MSSIMFIDIETNNVPYYGGVATPYCPDNYVVESAYAIDRTEDDGSVTVNPVYSIRFESREEFIKDTETAHNWFKIPDDCWLIVAFNAAYEISWFLQFQREHFEAFLKRGGRVFCSMQAQYIASDFQELYPSLDETAPLYGGTKKIDAVKLLWQQGVLTKDIDPHLLHDYLVNGDIPNTRLCFYGQCALFAERNQMPMVWERQDAVLALAYCEFNGVYVDMPTARANQKEQEDAIAVLKQTLQGFLPELPDGFEFNWNSGYHMSALVYGGMVKYKCKVPYDPPKYVKFDAYLVDVNGTQQYIDVNDWRDDWTYSREVFKSGRNKGLPKVFKVESSEQAMKWGERLYKFEGLVRIQDLPAVLQEKYAERGEFRGAQTLADGTPVFSTGTDAMKELANYFIGIEDNE
jgi:hypothetical protein